MSTAKTTGAPMRADWRVAACGALLSAAAVAAYSGTFSVPALFDDNGSIRDNPSIRHILSSFWPPDGQTVGGRPVLNISLAFNYLVSGTRLWSYHALNLAIHVAAALTLFGIVRRTLAARSARNATEVAFFAALLWALHPLLTESVTYVIQRAESLMGLFYLLTLYCVIRGAAADGARRILWNAGSVASCLLGMGTKEVMVSAPFVALLYDRTFLAGSWEDAVRTRRWLYGALAATWLPLIGLVLATHGRGGTVGFGSGISSHDYALTQLPAVIGYLRLSFWPSPLIFDYGVEIASQFFLLAASGLVIAGLMAATLWALEKRPALGFLGTSFFAILAPSSSFIPVVTETVSEHRMYLPLIPLVVLVEVGIHRWLGRAATAISAALAVGLFCATWTRNEIYRSEVGIWADTVKKAPNNERAHSNLGDILTDDGRFDEAIAERREALRLKPGSATVHNNMGATLARIPGRIGDAVPEFEEALRLRPTYAEADNNLGNALASEGRALEAVAFLEEALRLRPDFTSAHNNLGNALAQIPGRLDDAIAQYQEALRLNPELVSAHNNLGSALARTPGRLSEAMAQFEAALRLDPNSVAAHVNLGNALAKTPGRLSEAILQYEAAVSLKPDIAGLRVNLAIMLLDMPGRTGEAEAQLNEALRLQPGNAAARQLLERIAGARR
jgi:tetratricopeptide (TPR) repeat protein